MKPLPATPPASRQSSVQQIASWLGEGSINVFGSPFAGKDTQGPRLAQALQAPLVGGGALLREVQAELPPETVAKMHEGGLIDSAVFEQHVVPHLQAHAVPGMPLILSAFGRMHGEEAMAVQALDQAGHPLHAVLMLEISLDEVWRRWQVQRNGTGTRGLRADDTKSSLERRLSEFRTYTQPVLHYYANQGLLVTVDGEGDEATVFQRICTALAAGTPAR